MSSPPPNVTPQMRQAVYEDDCRVQGHLFRADFPTHQDEDADDMAHLKCSRCGVVHLIVPKPEPTYERARDRYRKLRADAQAWRDHQAAPPPR